MHYSAVVSADENPRLFAADQFKVQFSTELCASDSAWKAAA